MSDVDIDLHEEVYSLNFLEKFSDVAEFARASFMLSSTFLKSIGRLQLNDRQKACVLLIGKGKRLLRAIYKLATSGYWTEAEILLRAFFEAQMLLIYILEDKTGKRAKEWLGRSNPKERWPVSELLGGFDYLKSFYEQTSLYPHSHALSVSSYMKFTEDGFSMPDGAFGGDDNNQMARKILGTAAMMNASLLEISVPDFELPDPWHKEHQLLMEMPYFKERFSEVTLSPEQLQGLAKKLEKL